MTDSQLATQEFRLEQWKEIIQDRINSGLIVDEYCKLHNLSRNSYFYWLRKIKMDLLKTQVLKNSSNKPPQEESTIVEICPSQSLQLVPDSSATNIDLLGQTSLKSQAVVSIGGVSITVSDNTSDELLARVLKVVQNVK